MFLAVAVFLMISFEWFKCLHGQATTSFGANLFNKKLATSCGALRLGPGWYESSQISCAVSCTKRYPGTCYSFMYNKITKLCTPGSGVSFSQVPPTSHEGELFVSDGCGSYPEFSVHSYNTLTTFAAYFPAPVNYTQAAATCRCLDSHLFVARTQEKKAFFSNLSATCTWFGLDDMDVEGQFVLSDDHQPVDPVTLQMLFYPNAPDDYMGRQDCVRGCGQTFDDMFCEVQYPFYCEKTNSIC